jgi:hypothetical protein
METAMNVETKCRLSALSGGCIGFQEGHFVRFYQQGLYAWNRLTDTPLKICGRQIKKLDGVWLLSGGVPLKAFISQKPGVDVHKGIFFLAATWIPDDYERWYKGEINRLNAPNKQKKIGDDAHQSIWPRPYTSPLNVALQWDLLTSTRKENKKIIRQLKK